MIHSPARAQAVERFRPDPGRLYDLAWVSRLAGVSRHSVLVYCRWGLVRPVANPEEHGWYFNSEAIATVRHVEYLRVHEGVNLAGIRLILRLVEEYGHKFPSRW